MHTFNTLLLSFLAPLAIHAIALPPPNIAPHAPAIAPQAPMCYNAPGHKAGSPLKERSLLSPPLEPRAYSTTKPPPVTWCAPHSCTYVTFTYLSPLPPNDLTSAPSFLLTAHDVLVSEAKSAYDANAPLPAGQWAFHQARYVLSLQKHNATAPATEALTYALAEKAVAGLYEYSTGYLAKGGWEVGAVNFAVWDEATQVATGKLAWGFGA